MPLGMGWWGIENQFDVVRATFTDGTNVPRIPPVRVGGGLFWRDANWLARVSPTLPTRGLERRFLRRPGEGPEVVIRTV